MRLTREQARRFILLHQGLLGRHRFEGREGALGYVRQAGCIQYDPVDVCGKNAELTLLSRVKGFSREMLWKLLYEERSLFDYTDKNQAILPIEDWPCFERYRARSREAGARFEGIQALAQQAKTYVIEHGPADSDTLPLEGEIFWHSTIHWSGNWHGKSGAARSVLEQLYAEGEMIIHHKSGSRKAYDLAQRHIPQDILQAPDPYPDDAEHRAWRVLRRIGAIGLLWNRPSDAWLMIDGLDAKARNDAFEQLIGEGEIFPVQVDGVRQTLYCRERDRQTLLLAMSEETFAQRCEAIAPLDPMLWDRKLISALFDFSYSWEIYTPQEKRRYGYYVLPLVYGERFVGRAEAVREEKSGTLRVRHIWLEDGVRPTKKLDAAIQSCMKRLAKMNGCGEVIFEA